MGIFDYLDNNDRFVAAAKSAPKGMKHEHLTPGALVTVSASKASGDRSYCHDIYEVIVLNAGTVIMKHTGILQEPWSNKPAVLQIYEHEFYAAEHIAEAVRASSPV